MSNGSNGAPLDEQEEAELRRLVEAIERYETELARAKAEGLPLPTSPLPPYEPDCDPAVDDAIADAVWDEIHAEEGAKRQEHADLGQQP
jgi:hypothetical protein